MSEERSLEERIDRLERLVVFLAEYVGDHIQLWPDKPVDLYDLFLELREDVSDRPPDDRISG